MAKVAVTLEDVLLGLAAGDRIGGPTQMAVRVAESLTDCGRFDSDDVLRRYLAWWRAEGFDTGPTADNVFRKIASGASPLEACREVDREADGFTAGCNPAHRSIALAFSSLPDDDLVGAAREEAKLTHWHLLAGDVAVATVRICRALSGGRPWSEALIEGEEGRLPETQSAFAAGEVADLSPSGYAPDVLRAALWFVGHSAGLGEALHRSIVFAGPANYCPVLVGSLGGARWGIAGLSPDWYSHHGTAVERIHQVSARLHGDR